MDIIKQLEKLGYKTISGTYYSHIKEWRDWYKGHADFHNYKVDNGIKKIAKIRKSLGMAKKISEDKADLLLNEKVEINLAKETEQEYLDSVLDDNNFWVRGNQLVELSQALGTGAIVEYLDKGNTKLDFIPADCIFPLSWDNGTITECAFASKYIDKSGKYIYINLHTIENNQYVVRNYGFDEDEKQIEIDGVEPEWFTGSLIPMFQILTPNMVNNIDENIPMGISVFANSLPVLEGIDLVYDSYDNEFQLGKKRIFVDSQLIKVDYAAGNTAPVFDSNDTTFYGFPMGGEDGKNKPIQESNMQLRTDEHETALQSRLNMLSSKCGFGQNYYQFDHSGVKTATEVVSENSQMFRRLKKDEILLEKVLTDMVRAILYLGGKDFGTEINIAFDDSVIEDTEAISKRAMLELQSGIIDNVLYYQRVYGYTEEQALKLDADIKSRTPKEADMNFFAGGDGGDE